jgi:hypothetical protein
MILGVLVLNMRLTYLVRLFVEPNSRKYRIFCSEEEDVR